MNDFISFIQGLLGQYSAITDSSGVIPAGAAGVDWPYLVRAVVFIVVIYSVFRVLGGLLCKM